MGGLTDPMKDQTVLTFLFMYLMGVTALVAIEYAHRTHLAEFNMEVEGKCVTRYK